MLLVDSESFDRISNRARDPSEGVCMGKIASQVGVTNALLTSVVSFHCLFFKCTNKVTSVEGPISSII